MTNLQREFFEQLEARLAQGEAEYGDESMQAPLGNLVDEMIEEAVDIAGWAYPLTVRMKRLRVSVARFEAMHRFVEVARLLLGPGCHAKANATIHNLLKAVEVLDRELGEAGDEPHTGVCRVCGCTDAAACEGGCSWAGPNLCSQCAEKAPLLARSSG